jgi:hypothetical protein
LNFESWYNKPLECTPAFMDDITKNLGLWIERERAGASPTTKVRKYGKSQRASKEEDAAQNELPSGSFQKTWEDETALERIRRNQVGKKMQSGIVSLQDNTATKRSLKELGIPTTQAAMKPSESSSKRTALGTPRLAQSSGSGPGGSSHSKRNKVAFPLADSFTASIKRLTEAQPSRSDGSREFRSKEQPKSKLVDDAVELAAPPSTSESTHEWDELDVASVLAFCTAAELAEATNQQNSEVLARLVLGRMAVSSQTTAKMRGDTLGRELLRMGRVTRWLSGAVDIVYEVMCEAMRSPESDLAASLEQVGAHGTSAPQVLEDFARGMGWKKEGVVIDVTGPSSSSPAKSALRPTSHVSSSVEEEEEEEEEENEDEDEDEDEDNQDENQYESSSSDVESYCFGRCDRLGLEFRKGKWRDEERLDTSEGEDEDEDEDS